MQPTIKLVVGLGNPGPEYSQTRHNAGAWFVEKLAKDHNLTLRLEKKFYSQIGLLDISQQAVWLAIPTTFVNLSGQAVAALARFYKINPDEILVIYDELDFPVGEIRLRKGGSAAGHNGLKDIISRLSSQDFYRLRIGIGHPGDRDKVIDYVLSQPSKSDKKVIEQTIEDTLIYIPDLVAGKFEKVMQQLHTKR